MSESDIGIILRELGEFRAATDQKFGKLFDLVDSVCNRVGELETDKKVRDAICKEEENSYVALARKGATWALSGAGALWIAKLIISGKM